MDGGSGEGEREKGSELSLGVPGSREEGLRPREGRSEPRRSRRRKGTPPSHPHWLMWVPPSPTAAWEPGGGRGCQGSDEVFERQVRSVSG